MDNFWTDFVSWLLSLLPRAAGAAVIFGVGWWLSGAVTRFVKRAMARAKTDAGISSFLISLVNASLKVIVALMALAQLGVDVSSLIAALAAAGDAPRSCRRTRACARSGRGAQHCVPGRGHRRRRNDLLALLACTGLFAGSIHTESEAPFPEGGRCLAAPPPSEKNRSFRDRSWIWGGFVLYCMKTAVR